VSRYDKYEPKGGGFRAPLAANTVSPGDVAQVRAVSLNASGQVVIGTAGQSGFCGVIVQDKAMAAGDIIDVMTDGEIVDVGLAAGTKYYAAANGTLDTTTTNPLVGWTVEAGRLIVRVRPTVGSTV
jgi:hypothetical protein